MTKRGYSIFHSAYIRQLEIIGEAAGRVSEEIRTESADIPWKEIIGLRNILIHEYFGIDLDIVRDVIWTDMPKLKKEVKVLLCWMRCRNKNGKFRRFPGSKQI